MKVNCNKCGEKLLGHVCVNPDCNAENMEFRITKKRKTRTLRGATQLAIGAVNRIVKR